MPTEISLGSVLRPKMTMFMGGKVWWSNATPIKLFRLIIMIQKSCRLILVIISLLPLKCQGIPLEAILENQHFVAIPSIWFRGPWFNEQDCENIFTKVRSILVSYFIHMRRNLNSQVNLHPLFLFWKHGLVCDPVKKVPKYGLQKAGCKKTGSLLFKKRRGQAASSLFE